MNDERDPQLESLFSQNLTETADDGFTENVMAGVSRRRRNVRLVRLSIVTMLIAFEVLLSAPIGNSVGRIMDVLGTSLFDVGNGWLEMLLSPVNSIAGLIGLLLLLLHSIYRKIVH